MEFKNIKAFSNGEKDLQKIICGQKTVDGVNLLTDKNAYTISASSVNNNYIVENIVDGNNKTDSSRWISVGGDSKPTINIKFKSKVDIRKIILYTGLNNGSSNFIESFKLYINNNLFGEYQVGVYKKEIQIGNVECSELRLEFPAGYNRIYELEVIGSAVSENIVWELSTAEDIYLDGEGLLKVIAPMTTNSGSKKIDNMSQTDFRYYSRHHKLDTSSKIKKIEFSGYQVDFSAYIILMCEELDYVGIFKRYDYGSDYNSEIIQQKDIDFINSNRNYKWSYMFACYHPIDRDTIEYYKLKFIVEYEK